MTTAVLLNHDDPRFVFEHAMAHRNLYRVMYPLNQFSVMPYFVDPEIMTNVPASRWHLDHQQAHDDYSNVLQPYVGATRDGLFNGTNLADSNFADPESLNWWKHHNHMEHLIAETALLPDPRFRVSFLVKRAVREFVDEDIPWAHALARRRYGPQFDVDTGARWMRNIVLKNPLALHADRTDDAFCVTHLCPVIWFPHELEANVMVIVADDGCMWQAMALLRASMEWGKRHRATIWRIASETDYDLTPLARRLGAKDLSPRCALRL